MGPSYNCKVQLYSSPQIAETSPVAEARFPVESLQRHVGPRRPCGAGWDCWRWKSRLKRSGKTTRNYLASTKKDEIRESDLFQMK